MKDDYFVQEDDDSHYLFPTQRSKLLTNKAVDNFQNTPIRDAATRDWTDITVGIDTQLLSEDHGSSGVKHLDNADHEDRAVRSTGSGKPAGQSHRLAFQDNHLTSEQEEDDQKVFNFDEEVYFFREHLEDISGGFHSEEFDPYNEETGGIDEIGNSAVEHHFIDLGDEETEFLGDEDFQEELIQPKEIEMEMMRTKKSVVEDDDDFENVYTEIEGKENDNGVNHGHGVEDNIEGYEYEEAYGDIDYWTAHEGKQGEYYSYLDLKDKPSVDFHDDESNLVDGEEFEDHTFQPEQSTEEADTDRFSEGQNKNAPESDHGSKDDTSDTNTNDREMAGAIDSEVEDFESHQKGKEFVDSFKNENGLSERESLDKGVEAEHVNKQRGGAKNALEEDTNDSNFDEDGKESGENKPDQEDGVEAGGGDGNQADYGEIHRNIDSKEKDLEEKSFSPENEHQESRDPESYLDKDEDMEEMNHDIDSIKEDLGEESSFPEDQNQGSQDPERYLDKEEDMEELNHDIDPKEKGLEEESSFSKDLNQDSHDQDPGSYLLAEKDKGEKVHIIDSEETDLIEESYFPEDQNQDSHDQDSESYLMTEKGKGEEKVLPEDENQESENLDSHLVVDEDKGEINHDIDSKRKDLEQESFSPDDENQEGQDRESYSVKDEDKEEMNHDIDSKRKDLEQESFSPDDENQEGQDRESYSVKDEDKEEMNHDIDSKRKDLEQESFSPDDENQEGQDRESYSVKDEDKEEMSHDIDSKRKDLEEESFSPDDENQEGQDRESYSVKDEDKEEMSHDIDSKRKDLEEESFSPDYENQEGQDRKSYSVKDEDTEEMNHDVDSKEEGLEEESSLPEHDNQKSQDFENYLVTGKHNNGAYYEGQKYHGADGVEDEVDLDNEVINDKDKRSLDFEEYLVDDEDDFDAEYEEEFRRYRESKRDTEESGSGHYDELESYVDHPENRFMDDEAELDVNDFTPEDVREEPEDTKDELVGTEYDEDENTEFDWDGYDDSTIGQSHESDDDTDEVDIEDEDFGPEDLSDLTEDNGSEVVGKDEDIDTEYEEEEDFESDSEDDDFESTVEQDWKAEDGINEDYLEDETSQPRDLREEFEEDNENEFLEDDYKWEEEIESDYEDDDFENTVEQDWRSDLEDASKPGDPSDKMEDIRTEKEFVGYNDYNEEYNYEKDERQSTVEQNDGVEDDTNENDFPGEDFPAAEISDEIESAVNKLVVDDENTALDYEKEGDIESNHEDDHIESNGDESDGPQDEADEDDLKDDTFQPEDIGEEMEDAGNKLVADDEYAATQYQGERDVESYYEEDYFEGDGHDSSQPKDTSEEIENNGNEFVGDDQYGVAEYKESESEEEEDFESTVSQGDEANDDANYGIDEDDFEEEPLQLKYVDQEIDDAGSGLVEDDIDTEYDNQEDLESDYMADEYDKMDEDIDTPESGHFEELASDNDAHGDQEEINSFNEDSYFEEDLMHYGGIMKASDGAVRGEDHFKFSNQLLDDDDILRLKDENVRTEYVGRQGDDNGLDLLRRKEALSTKYGKEKYQKEPEDVTPLRKNRKTLKEILIPKQGKLKMASKVNDEAKENDRGEREKTHINKSRVRRGVDYDNITSQDREPEVQYTDDRANDTAFNVPEQYDPPFADTDSRNPSVMEQIQQRFQESSEQNENATDISPSKPNVSTP